MFLSVFSYSVMGLVLTSTCVLCAGLFSPTARAASTLALPLHPPDPLETSYLNLPMFLHFRKPRVDKRHFSPTQVKSSKLMPKRVRQVLVPEPRRRTKSRARESGPISVSCNAREMRVRVDAANLEAGMHVRLGTCDVTRQTEQSVLFRYELQACGTQRQILNEMLVYSNMLHYTPDSSGFGSEPFSVPVQCHFNRFHYSYKIGYVPSVERLKFLKPIKTKGSVSLAVCDAQWNRLSPSQAVVGRPMHFEAEALYMPEDQRLFLTSCYVNTNSSRDSTPQVTVIDNYGCLIDSKRSSHSRFINSTRRNVVRFIIDAFGLQGEEQKYLFIHCEMSIRSLVPTETSKMCSYNQLEHRWEELNGADSVCSCCDSSCVPEIPTIMRPSSELKSLVKQHPEVQKNQLNPAQSPERIFTPEPKHEIPMRENLLRTEPSERTLASEHENGTDAPESAPTLKGMHTMPKSEHKLITPETPPTRESEHEKISPETPPTPVTPLMLDNDYQSLTLKHESRTLMPEIEHLKITPETPPTLGSEYGTLVPDTEREKFTPYTLTTIAPSVQQTTVTQVNTNTIPLKPYRIFEEVFGLN